VAAGDDAELIRLCAEFHRLHGAANAAPGDDNAAIEAALDARWETSDAIQRTPAATIDGHRAEASVAIVLLRENNRGDEFSSGDAAFAYATLLDIASNGRFGVASVWASLWASDVGREDAT
jgi:hypothetical protein